MSRRGRIVARARSGRRDRIGAAGHRVGARVSDQDGAGGERRAGRSAPERAADLRRGGRAAVRDHLGDRRRGPAGDDRSCAADRRRIRTRSWCRCEPHLPEGWYLIYWRAISVDGHPVQGAFTYAVGPNPGPAPQFPVPSISATATSPQVLIPRWVMFFSVMAAIGLFVLRMLIARPVVRRVPGDEPARAVGRVRGRVGTRRASRSRCTWTSRPRTTRCARCSTSRRWCRCSA